MLYIHTHTRTHTHVHILHAYTYMVKDVDILLRESQVQYRLTDCVHLYPGHSLKVLQFEEHHTVTLVTLIKRMLLCSNPSYRHLVPQCIAQWMPMV